MGKMTRPDIAIINLKCWSILGSLSIFYQHQHVLSTRQSNFQLSVESYSGLVWFHLSSHCYWSRRFAPSPQPIRCKTKNNRDLVIAFSRASSSLLVFIFEFSLASDKGSFFPIYQLGYFWFLVFRHALDNWPKTRKICYLLSLLIPNSRYLIATSHAHCSEVLTCDIPGFPRINMRTISRNMRNSR